MSSELKYPGEELALFEEATNWKKYFSQFILPLLKGTVLECGAGIGGTTSLLNINTASEWILLEPDTNLHETLNTKINAKLLPSNCMLKKGTLGSLDSEEMYDCIIYIDVLEHIENDSDEIILASSHLKTGGSLIVLSPAFMFLFSPFDKAIGHYRRYTKKTLKIPATASLTAQRMFYLDSIGFFASLVNKLLLKQKYPSRKQVLFWDKWMIPVSKVTDRIFFYSFGKSILAIWRKKPIHAKN